MTSTSIKSQFTRHIKKSMGSENPRLNMWYCGITNNELRRKAEHNRKHIGIDYWKCLGAETVLEANEVEKYFSGKGTINKPSRNGAIEKSTFVYIFKMPFRKTSEGLNAAVSVEHLLGQLFK